jgi:hypothetical protein
LGETLLKTASTQTTAAIGTATEITTLQTDFMKRQFDALGQQTKNFFELSAKMTRDSLDAMTLSTPAATAAQQPSAQPPEAQPPAARDTTKTRKAG